MSYYYAFIDKQRLSVTPSASGLLFYPRDLAITVPQNRCETTIAEFSARPGLYVSGSVTPASAGVHMMILDKVTGGVVAEVDTDAAGKYSTGPLYDDHKYEVVCLQYFSFLLVCTLVIQSFGLTLCA